MGREHKMNVSEQVRAHHAVLVSDLERAAAFAVAGERVGKLPPDTELPPVDLLVRFGDDAAFSDTWQQFSSYCARYSVLVMMTACEYYVGQLLFVARVARHVSETHQTMPVEEFWKIAEECQQELRHMSPKQVVEKTFALLKRDRRDVAGLAWFDSLYQLRKCLVHRKGQVGVEDGGPEGELRVIWRKVTPIVDDEPITSRSRTFEKGSRLGVMFEEQVRSWKVGEAIDLTVGDCQGIALSLFLFSKEFSDQVHAGLREFVPLGP